MKTELTPQEVAEHLIIAKGFVISRPELYKSLQIAAADELKIANGEYTLVVHGRWIEEHDEDGLSWGTYYCSVCHKSPCNDYNEKPALTDYCPFCGALMDENSRPGNFLNGKEDSHETD